MLNQVIFVGRLTANPVVKTTDNEKEYSTVTVAVPRSYKNEEEVYETDFIPVKLWNAIASNTAEYCKKGDLIGIKGHIQVNNKKLEVIADKVTFLSSSKRKDEEE